MQTSERSRIAVTGCIQDQERDPCPCLLAPTGYVQRSQQCFRNCLLVVASAAGLLFVDERLRLLYIITQACNTSQVFIPEVTIY